MEPQSLALVVIAFGAAAVNGALGYGFSSITVPLSLLFLSNRVLNPALVMIEIALNAYVLWVNRDAVERLAIDPEHVGIQRDLDQHERGIQHPVRQEQQRERHRDRREAVPQRAVDRGGAEGDECERE